MLEQLYGEDATEWLRRWDDSRWVWSVRMGHFGSWHEQDIQTTAAELLRIMLNVGFDPARWDTDTVWQDDCEVLDHIALQSTLITSIGLVGDPRGKALALAGRLFRDGPVAMMIDSKLQDRRLIIRNNGTEQPRERNRCASYRVPNVRACPFSHLDPRRSHPGI